jgi:hypothetical protein
MLLRTRAAGLEATLAVDFLFGANGFGGADRFVPISDIDQLFFHRDCSRETQDAGGDKHAD